MSNGFFIIAFIYLTQARILALNIFKHFRFKLFQLFLFELCIMKIMNKPVLYVDVASPPCRFVEMTAKLLNIELDMRKIELFAGEHKTEEFTKINPLQKVPVMIVGDTKILDSHAAAIYLCQRESDEELYPTDPLLRARINEMMFYNSGRLFPLDSEILSLTIAGKPVPEKKIEEWYSALDYLEINLNNQEWLIGNKMYLCDLCAMLTVTSMSTVYPILERHGNIKEWLKRFERLPFYDLNRQGLNKLKSFIEKFNQQRKE